MTSPTTSSNSKLIALIMCYTVATAAMYLLHLAFGETEVSDWRTWAQLAPPLTVTLIFGILASGWRQVTLFAITSIVIDFVFANTSFYFDPVDWEPLSPLTGGSQPLSPLSTSRFRPSSFTASFIWSQAFFDIC